MTGTRHRVRVPFRTAETNTVGWYATIGDLGSNQARLEIWLDRFSGYAERKLFACFRSESRQQITSITSRVSRKLWPVRIFTDQDVNVDSAKTVVLTKRLARTDFNTPILERYRKCAARRAEFAESPACVDMTEHGADQ